MSDVSERLIIHCTDHQAVRHLADFIGDHTARDGSVRITLRLPAFTLGRRMRAVTRDVIVTLYPLRTLREAHATYSIAWSPSGGGPFPTFAGALAIEGSRLDNCVGLIVSGHYETPLGVAGVAFDALVGRHIARASARDLLNRIGRYIERHAAAETVRADRFAPLAPA